MSDTSEIKESSVVEILLICAFNNCTEQNVKKCRKCNRPFCIIHCNTFSPNFCKDCFKELSIIQGKFKREFDNEIILPNGQLRHEHIVEERTKYYMDGPDWPFVTPWIDSLNDNELRTLWVFHHCIMRLIESENETRKIERFRKLQGQPVPKLITSTSTNSQGLKTKRTTVIDTPESVRARLKKQGLPDNIIDMMVSAMNKGA